MRAACAEEGRHIGRWSRFLMKRDVIGDLWTTLCEGISGTDPDPVQGSQTDDDDAEGQQVDV